MDSSFLRVYIYGCPEEQQRAVLDVLAAEDLAFEYPKDGLDPELPAAELSLTTPYVAAEASLQPESVSDLADALVAAAPEVSFRAWQNSNYGNPGWLHAYTPELGSYAHEVWNSDDVALTWKEMEAAIGTETLMADVAKRRLHDAAGGPWAVHFALAKEDTS